MKNHIVQIAAQDLASLFEGKHIDKAATVTWIRTPDFQTQLYLDNNFSNIWLRDPQLIIDNPFVFNDFLLEEDHDEVVTEIKNRNGGYESGQVIFRIVRPDGEMRWIKDTSYYIYDKSNSVSAVVGMAEAISPECWHTLRKQNQLKVNNSNEASAFEKVLIDLLKNEKRFTSNKKLAEKPSTAHENKIYYVELNGKKIFLSKRESDCIDCFLQGMTAKETAKTLNISPRTVEDYLENMKVKTSSANKLELILKIKRVEA